MQQNCWLNVPCKYFIPVRIAFILLFLLSFNYASAQDEIPVVGDSIFIFRSLKEAMLSPEKVYRLNLSKTKLDSFPQEVLLMTNLVELDLSKNKLEEIPAGIGTLVHLKRLNLANNKLVHLPDEIGRLTELEYLGLNRNILEDIPATIGSLSKMEVLELWDNELNTIPDEISQLGNLRVLELRGILLSDEEQKRIDSLVVRSAKIHMSPSCNCKN